MKRVQVRLMRRELGRKSEIKRLRKEGYVPVEVYGKGVENRHAYISLKDLKSFPQGETFLVEADIDGERVVCLLKEVQMGWLGDNPIHVDLQDISQVKEIDIEVPIEFVGAPAGVSLGGTFEPLLHSLTVRARIDSLPEKIRVDVSGLGLGDALHVRDIVPPEGCVIMDSPEETVAVVLEPEVEETAVAE
ncbi:MAG: 50S ribosomal protein L25/general stress protein Ctc [Aquificaceae bacterium]|nr:50S ribosomal protein L25/general stress protein Ctc [Aquificaceae bacterium]MCS7196215.1 50S ribosomal protein L25/general stress protein Ctc [Aquificaceae bacterium]MCX7989937.1 50S ribosomal protein L25/general stress protein Ctc [Aquificaceae bacterium]MDW8032509.1 50S ribosomal protein L25/general stress protein Ctc [Aquificaceae bacterium]MDW8293806.1 50S ribosomal protein L25/general stress protein Ctc [Aquificaceae bacterium]